MAYKRSLISFLMVAGLIQSNIASAQQAVHPAKNDPSLYSSFFFVMDDFSAWLEARGTAVPANKTKLMQSAARYLHVEVSELPKVRATCQFFAATIRQINANARNYVDSSVNGQQLPDSTVLGTFEAQRQAAIQAGISSLQKQLSAASWNGVVAHINGEHRNSIQMNFPAVSALPPSPAR